MRFAFYFIPRSANHLIYCVLFNETSSSFNYAALVFVRLWRRLANVFCMVSGVESLRKDMCAGVSDLSTSL